MTITQRTTSVMMIIDTHILRSSLKEKGLSYLIHLKEKKPKIIKIPP